MFPALSVVNDAEACLVNAERTAARVFDDMPPAVGQGNMVLDGAIHGRPSRYRRAFWLHGWEPAKGRRSVRFNSGSSFEGLDGHFGVSSVVSRFGSGAILHG